MIGENPGAFDEARKRIRENKEGETVVLEKQKEDFEKGKEKVRSKKKLDVFELKRRIETGHSLNTLKSDIRQALESGQISIDTYTNAIEMLDRNDEKKRDAVLTPEYILPPGSLPFSDTNLAKYFDAQKIGENIFIDIAGFAYGFAQGSLFLLYLLGRIIIDTLLLPVDIYTSIHEKSPPKI